MRIILTRRNPIINGILFLITRKAYDIRQKPGKAQSQLKNWFRSNHYSLYGRFEQKSVASELSQHSPDCESSVNDMRKAFGLKSRARQA